MSTHHLNEFLFTVDHILTPLITPSIYRRAAEYLVRTGPVVTLEVAKQGAIYHGLATLLSQPSPVMGRGKKQLPIFVTKGSFLP